MSLEIGVKNNNSHMEWSWFPPCTLDFLFWGGRHVTTPSKMHTPMCFSKKKRQTYHGVSYHGNCCFLASLGSVLFWWESSQKGGRGCGCCVVFVCLIISVLFIWNKFNCLIDASKTLKRPVTTRERFFLTFALTAVTSNSIFTSSPQIISSRWHLH